MRVLLVGFNQVGRGTYWRLWQFAQALARRGHEVTLMSTSPAARVRLHRGEAGGVRLVQTPDLLSGALRSGWDPWNALRRVLWLSARGFDVIHAAETRPVVLLPALYARRRGAALIMDWCDWFGRGGSVEERANPLVQGMLRPVETYLEEHFRTRADGTATINAFLRDRAVSLGVSPDRVAVIRQACNPDILPRDQMESRLKTGLPEGVPLIGYAGTIFQRDAELMAAALNCVQRRLPEARLVLAGYFNRNIEDLLDRPETLIRTGPLANVEQVHAYLAACDLCWLPFRDTGANRGRWPSKINDYMALGRPVVTTAVGDLGDVVTRLAMGLASPDAPEPFAARTVELLKDKECASAMGRAAREAAETEFSMERSADRLLALYRQALAARRGRQQ